MGRLVAAALEVIWRGAEEVGEETGVTVETGGVTVVIGVVVAGGAGGVTVETTGGSVVAAGGAVTVEKVVALAVTNVVPPEVVAVRSDGTVTVSLSATLVARVIGIETVAFVVGGSVVVVTVKVNVSSTSLDSVAVFVIKNVSVSVTATLVARVIGTTTVAFVVGGLAVSVIVKDSVTSTVLVSTSVWTIVDKALTVVKKVRFLDFVTNTSVVSNVVVNKVV
jgi:hypothetical protein